jgi:hypothetical protein
VATLGGPTADQAIARPGALIDLGRLALGVDLVLDELPAPR